MHSRLSFANALVISITALGITACSSDPQEKYVAELRSSNEVPANSSAAAGRVVRGAATAAVEVIMGATARAVGDPQDETDHRS